MCLVEFTAFSAIVAATAALTAVCFGCCLHARYRGCGGIDLPSACMAANDLERLNSVHTLLRLSAPVDASDAVEFFERFALRCGGRFLQVLNTDAVWPKWEQSPVPFDAAQHVAVDDAVSDAYALQEAVCATLSEPMPRQRPPWRVVLYNNLPDSEGGPAVLLKMHHCMGDGVGLMRIVVQALMESHREVHADAQPTTGTGSRGAGSRRGGGRDRPSVFAMARRLPAAVFKILAMRPDRPSAVHRSDRIPPGSKRVAAWSSLDRAELGVDRLKKIAASLSCTINDLLVAAVCGGLRRYADEEGGQVAPATTLAVWFSLSPLSTVYKPITAESPARWGNGALGAVYLRGPLEERDSVERLDIVMKQTAALKASPEPWVAQSVMSLFGALPGPLSRLLFNATAWKSSVSYSNMPGPTVPMHLASAEVTDVTFFVPPQGNIAIFVTIMSYNGGFSVGAACDPRLFPLSSAQRLVEVLIPAELKHLASAGALH